MTKEFIDFVRNHEDDDTARLLLSAARYPDIDVPLAVQQIEGRRTAREKWPSLASHDDYLYPPRLNREQASSEATAHYKAAILGPTGRVVDLTGGMGIDTMALAQTAHEVDYVERDLDLCRLMEHNCRTMGLSNIRCHCADSLEWLVDSEPYDLIYIDPARRGASGRRVAAFEDCTPNLLNAMPMLRQKGRQWLVKASPMLDITLALKQLQTVDEIHIVALKGECKEVLFLAKGGSDTTVHCVELDPEHQFHFTFQPHEEAKATVNYADTISTYLYDPHVALRKACCFHLIGQRYGLSQLAPDTHLYTSPTLVADFPGRIFHIEGEVTLNRKAVREVLPDGKAHVVVRNFPTEAAALQRQLGLNEGGDRFVIATTIGHHRAGFLCKQV